MLDSFPSAHILVVEDDAATRETLQALLEDEGYVVTCAADAPAALEHAERQRIDLILLDLVMPIMDGRSFGLHYRQMPGPHAPIVVVTASQHVPDDVAQIPAAAFVRKPFDVDELLAVVRRVITAHLESTQPAQSVQLVQPGEAPTPGTAPRDASAAFPRPHLAPAWRTQRPAPFQKRMRERLEQQQRVRALQRLQQDVIQLRQQLNDVSEQTRGLLAAQEDRLLTPAETLRARALARESERLRWELQRLLHEFERIRTSRDHG